jgi:hypothetical protein
MGAALLPHDHGVIQPLRQEADPTIDLAQTAFAVGVLGVLGAVTLRGCVGHLLHHARPFLADELLQLVSEKLCAFGGEVIRHRTRARLRDGPGARLGSRKPPA